jgi:membrane protein
MLAFLVALAAFVLFTIVSGAVVTSRLMEHAYVDQPAGWLALPLDGIWPALGLWLGLTMLYRYAMAHAKRVAWKAAIIGGLVATVMSSFFSWLCTIYVEQIVHLGATYGSVGAVVVLLIWLSWNVNAVFYGGAFATELEIEWERNATPPEPVALPDTVVNLSERRQSRQ